MQPPSGKAANSCRIATRVPCSVTASTRSASAALMAVALDRAGQDTAAAGPWGHGLVGLVRSAADWWLRGERPMLRSELAAHLTDLAWAGLSRVAAPAPPSKEEP